MTTVLDDNVHNFGVDGSSDDLDVPIKVVIITIVTGISPIKTNDNNIFKTVVMTVVHQNYFFYLKIIIIMVTKIILKAVFADPEYVAKHNLCSINSINWAR